jgi:death on curing protein
VEANRFAIAFGGLPGIRREDDIRAAIGRPYSGYHRRIERKAAALFQSIACSHGFNDGNKRTAVLLVDLLLERSGYRVQPATVQEDLTDAYEAFTLRVVTDHPDFDDIVAWFRTRIARAAR